MYVSGKGHSHFGPGTSMVQFHQPATGLGCACKGGGMGCSCRGMGLFDTGTDFSGWGIPEWGIVLLGGYMLLSTLFTTERAASRVSNGIRRYRSRQRAI